MTLAIIIITSSKVSMKTTFNQQDLVHFEISLCNNCHSPDKSAIPAPKSVTHRTRPKSSNDIVQHAHICSLVTSISKISDFCTQIK